MNFQATGTWPERPIAFATKPGALTYTKVTISTDFLADSCTIGDYNGDGNADVSSGRRWYEGPDFTTAHVFRGGHEALPRTGDEAEALTGMSDDWSDFAVDLNGDGKVDIINISNASASDKQNPAAAPAPQTHASAFWYENPGNGSEELWSRHLMHGDVQLESHGLFDVNHDGQPEFYGACLGCEPQATKGYYQGDPSAPEDAWTYHAVTREYAFPGGAGFIHGLGFGDVNGDQQPDLLERDGAWLDATAATPNLTQCPGASCGWVKTMFWDGSRGANGGGAQMFAFDVDGDGDADVVSTDNAHGYGLAWYEQASPLVFTRRQFLGSAAPSDVAKYGMAGFSQAHALEAVDMDGDGVPDLVTGKEHFALPNGFGEPDIDGAPVLYVFKTVRDTPSDANGGSVTFEPHLVDDGVGVGQQLAVGHLNDDGIMDICVASKLGLYAFLGE